MTKACIMIVEDEAITALDLRKSLEELGCEVVAIASSGEDAVAQAGSICPDLILMDISLKGVMSGIEAAGQIRAANKIPIIFLTAHHDSETVAKVKTTEPYGFLLKPCCLDTLKNSIEYALNLSIADARIRKSDENFRLIREGLETRAMEITTDLNESLDQFSVRCRT